VPTEAKRREINSEAVVWFKKASEQGDAFGSFRYGWLYLEKPALEDSTQSLPAWE
jgi:TPR repeat protein